MHDVFDYLESSSLTDTGLKRENNEDAVCDLREFGAFCVADGMGGASSGEVASQAVVDHLTSAFSADTDRDLPFIQRIRRVQEALNRASIWIKRHADDKGVSGTGTTVVTLVFDHRMKQRAVVMHAGDSRAYRFRKGVIKRISKDHSMAEEYGLGDEEELPVMFRGIITRAVGLDKTVRLERTPASVKPGDVYMLCSDGLTRMLSDDRMCQILQRFQEADLSAMARELVDQANEEGGLDNISVVLVRVSDYLKEGEANA